MSFFQKMIKIHHHQPTTTPQPQQTSQSQQQASNQLQQQHQIEKVKVKEAIRSSRKYNVYNIELQEKGWQDIADEPKADKIYKSMKVSLITPLLPLRQQLLRDMIVKKKQFFAKTLVNSQILKKNSFKSRLQQSSFKYNQQKKCLPLQDLEQSKVNSTNKKKKPSKMSSCSISKSQASNKESVTCVIANGAQQNSDKRQQSSSDLNKQVMMKLLNLLEKQQNDRNNLMSISMNQISNIKNNNQDRQQRYQRQGKQKQAPIVINNIMRTPVNSMGKDFMEQQMKIRMLQKDRYAKKTNIKNQNIFLNKQLSDVKLIKTSQIKQKLIKEYLVQQQNNLKTERSLLSQPYGQIIQISESRHLNQTNMISSIQNSRINTNHHKIQNSRLKNEIKVQLSQYPVQSVNLQYNHQKDNYYSTNSNSYNSEIKQSKEDSRVEKGKRKREFPEKSNKRNKQNQPINKKESPASKISETQNFNYNSQKREENDQKNTIKPPVLIQIPFDDNKNAKGMTLAQAFKAKIGKLKSEKQKSLTKMTPKSNRHVQLFTKPIISSTIELDLTKQIQIQSSPLFTEQSNFKTISIRSSKNGNQKLVTKQSSISKLSDNQTAKITREPSKQLLDRLIYGQRAKISKKEMYSLTKKNYENLPEVQAKKKQIEKKKIEQERMQKIKEYQYSIRNNKVNKPVLK